MNEFLTRTAPVSVLVAAFGILVGCQHQPLVSSQISCTKIAQALEPELGTWFEKHPQSAVSYCNMNPRRDRLWTGSESDPRKGRLSTEYCQMSPVFRTCLVCEVLANRSIGGSGHDSVDAYRACASLLSGADEKIAERIWETDANDREH